MEDYQEHDGLGLAGLVARREVSPDELLDAALARLDRVEPRINALTQRLADHGRAAIARGLPAGPFTGVPFLLKDVSALLEGTATTGGSRLFDGSPADHDSTIVARYKDAGLVIFGKTNTPEFGLAASTESSHFGPTRNPWDLTRTAGGSSGGAAAAVAAGIVPMAHGSDGGGSIRIPASACGLFGLKPTRARITAGPDVGEGWGGLAVQHVLTRSVRDSAAMLDATHGCVLGDPYWTPPVERPYRDEIEHDPDPLRVALMRSPASSVEVHADCVAALDEAHRLFADLGHHVADAAPEIDADALRLATWAIAASAVNLVIRNREAETGRTITEADVEPVTWQAVRYARDLGPEDYPRAIQTVHRHGRRMAAFHHRYDVILSPTLGQPPVPLGPQRMGNPDFDEFVEALRRFSPFTSVFNLSGQPSMSVPLHWTAEGLPVGVMVSGRFGGEALLFQLAAQLERARPWAHRRPEL